VTRPRLGCLLAAIVVPAFAGVVVLPGEDRGGHKAPRATHASATSAAEVGASVTPAVARGADGRLLTEVVRVRVGSFPVALAVAERQGHVFVLNQDPRETSLGSVSMLDSRTGRVLGVVPVGRGARTLAVDERTGRVFVLNAGPTASGALGPNGAASVSVLDAATGRVLRTTAVGRGAQALIIDDRRGRVLVAIESFDPPTVQGRLPITKTFLRILDATMGALQRTLVVHDAGFSGGSLVLDPPSGDLFVGGGACPYPPPPSTNFTCVTRLDGMTGRVRARSTIPNDDTLPVVVSGLADDPVAGRLVVYFADGHGTGYVAVLVAATGAVLTTTPLRASSDYEGPALAIDARCGCALVVVRPSSYDGPAGPFEASVFETRGGALRGSVDVSEVGGRGGISSEYGALPEAAVDGRTGRAFVVTGAFLPAAHAYGPPRSPRPNVVTVLDLAGVRVLGAIPVGRG